MARRSSALAAIAVVAGLVLAGCGDKTPTTPPDSESIARDSVGPLPGNAQLTTATTVAEISATARFVAFISSDAALPSHDGVAHVYRYDRQTGDVILVSSKGAQGRVRISDDGASIAFTDMQSPSHVWRTQLTGLGGDQQIDVVPGGGPSADDASTLADMTPDGSQVLFFSLAKNLAGTAESTATLDLFRWSVGGILRCTWTDSGAQSTGGVVDATSAAISADGRYVVFASSATDLVGTATGGFRQVYRRDLVALGASSPSLTLVSANGAAAGNADSLEPDISGDGARVSFTSSATNLLSPPPTATPSGTNVYVADIGSSAVVVAASWNVAASTATLAGGTAAHGRISQDGHVVAFVSATALTTGASSGSDIYVRDVNQASTRRVSVAGDGSPANAGSADPSITADGSSIEFASGASNLIATDTNGVSDIFVALMPPVGSG